MSGLGDDAVGADARRQRAVREVRRRVVGVVPLPEELRLQVAADVDVLRPAPPLLVLLVLAALALLRLLQAKLDLRHAPLLIPGVGGAGRGRRHQGARLVAPGRRGKRRRGRRTRVSQRDARRPRGRGRRRQVGGRRRRREAHGRWRGGGPRRGRGRGGRLRARRARRRRCTRESHRVPHIQRTSSAVQRAMERSPWRPTGGPGPALSHSVELRAKGRQRLLGGDAGGGRRASRRTAASHTRASLKMRTSSVSR